MLTISKKISKISASPTLAITSVAKAMKREGKDVINFGAGEPDFDTPLSIKKAAKKAIDSGFTKYTPASGTVELKKAICNKLFIDNGLRYKPSNIIVSCGAKHSLYNIFQALCNPGDEVIIIAPYWVSYPEMIKMAGAKPVVVKTKEKNGFKASPREILRHVTTKTKAIIINSPSNPAGIVYSRADLAEFADIAVRKKMYVVSDEIYEKLLYDGHEHVSIASLGNRIADQSIVVNGVSKAFSMTGWRIGYCACPERIAGLVSVIQSHSTSNPTSISQKAALNALGMDASEIEKMRSAFAKRRNIMMGLLERTSRVTCTRPQGAFYLYCNISRTGKRASIFAQQLLKEKMVAVIPGEAFGSSQHIRLSFATDVKTIQEGVERITSWVGQ